MYYQTYNRILIFFLVMLFSLRGAGQNVASEEGLKKLTPPELREDFDLLQTALEKSHPALYRYTPKERMDSLFKAMQQRIDHAMTAMEFYSLAAPVVGFVKCGHTRLYPSRAIMEYLFTKAKGLPFDLKILDNKIFILQNRSEDSSLSAGAEILSINSVPSAAILSKLYSMVFSDGHNTTMRPKIIESIFAPLYCMAYGEMESFTLDVLQPHHSSAAHVTVKAISISPEQRKRSRPASLQIHERTALLTIKTFEPPRFERSGVDYERFIDSAFAAIKKQSVKDLIIDLRNNNGGEPHDVQYLFSYLAAKPFHLLKQPEFKTDQPLDFFGDDKDSSNYKLYYKDHLKPNGAGAFAWNDVNNNWYGVYEPVKENYKGAVYVLMDGGSFSSTGFFCSLIRHYKRGILIGEESGGADRCNDCHGTLLLPHTELKAEIPRCSVFMDLNDIENNGRGIMPDHGIHLTLDDVLSEKDPALEKAHQLIGENKLQGRD